MNNQTESKESKESGEATISRETDEEFLEQVVPEELEAEQQNQSVFLFPKLSQINESEDGTKLTFRIEDANVSIVNALRRIILSEIPTVVIRSTPYDKNRVNIEVNTTRMNNEIIKQRLSCIPVYINENQFPSISELVLELNVKNDSTLVAYATSGDFKIKNAKTNTYISDQEVKNMFPADPITGDYIDIVRLRPKTSNNGEELKLTCSLDIGTSKEDSSFAVASTCCYSCVVDEERVEEAWNSKKGELQANRTPPEEMILAEKNWRLLDSKRITVPDAFNFTVETVGVFTNKSIVVKACKIMIDKLSNIREKLSMRDVINKSISTIENCYDITLESEDYTLGKVLEYMLYSKHYDRVSNTSDKTLHYCGFSKPHPHINSSIIRIGFVENVDMNTIVSYMNGAAIDAIRIFEMIGSAF